jgi:asparagine synthase (glutamine-hydrolysing)
LNEAPVPIMKLYGHLGPGLRPDAVVTAPYLHCASGVTVALTGGPVWLDGIEAASPAEAILTAYMAQGPGLLARLSGRFALAVWDQQANRALLALDRMGIERLTYAMLGERLVFSSSAAEVAAVTGVDSTLRPQALFDFLLLHMIPAPDTVYAGVSKLRPGTCAILENGRLRIERYWLPRFPEAAHASGLELREGLLVALRDAVAACRPDEATGAFLSGGLDSSTVAGMLAQVSGKPPQSFSIGFGVDEFNELEYARVASQHFGTRAHEYDVTPEDIVAAFTDIAAAYDEPFGNSSAVPTYLCARLAARHGVGHLLAGDGGDEIFGGNERYARQRIFEAYVHLPGWLRRGVLEPLLSGVDPEYGISPLRKARSYMDQARIPMPERLESWNYMYRIDLGSMLEPDFRAAVDPRAPLGKMAEVYAAAPSGRLLHRMLFYDWHYTLSDNDLRKVGTMCEIAGVRVSYPMLDPRVVDLSLRVPPTMMQQGLSLRSFYKQAMRGFLPVAILAKKKHGFSLPFGVWLKTHAGLGELIYGLLGDFKARRIVQPAFIDNLIAEHRAGHPGYFGYAIWDLAMLEAWLQAQSKSKPAAQTAARP